MVLQYVKGYVYSFYLDFGWFSLNVSAL